LRLACCLIVERGIKLLAPVHDAVLVESAADDIDATVAATEAAMREAGEMILGGFQLRTDADVVTYPARYRNERGEEMWSRVTEIVNDLNTVPGQLGRPTPANLA
ncbi:MAG: hypothetical protein ABGZ35_28815, partial [Planctomycetaceae bacterium]